MVDVTANRAPEGLRLITSFEHRTAVARLAWSPDGRQLAGALDDGSLFLWRWQEEPAPRSLRGHDAPVDSIAWASSSGLLASYGLSERIWIWDVERSTQRNYIRPVSVNALAWSQRGDLLACATQLGSVDLYQDNGRLVAILDGHVREATCVACSPAAPTVASGSADKTIRLWSLPTAFGQETVKDLRSIALEGHAAAIRALAWTADGARLASASDDATIRIWDPASARVLGVLEGHTDGVCGLGLSADGALIATSSIDGTIALWRHDRLDRVVSLRVRDSSLRGAHPVALHPRAPYLATSDAGGGRLYIWEIDTRALRSARPASATVHRANSKVVLVGESDAGKSSLALRLVEKRFDSQMHTTQGMRFWRLDAKELSLAAAPADSTEEREITIWDMGGQREYRIVHQLFLYDTSLALVLFDPSRGDKSLDEVEAWSARMDKQLRGRNATKLLVGTKRDRPDAPIPRARLERIVRECGFAEYIETSAMTGDGYDDLREAMARALVWPERIARPELFQHIRDEVERRRRAGELVVSIRDLAARVRADHPEDFDEDVLDATVTQLGLQGVVKAVHLSSGDRVLVLQIHLIEIYAGSVISAARNNPAGVPAIEQRQLASPDMVFPGITRAQRLPRDEERLVLDCVVQLLIEHGICIEHAGLLIFPSLFEGVDRRRPASLPHAVLLLYDFAGATDNIYSSLVASLTILGNFGALRLWENRAEFQVPGHGTCGLRRVDHGNGTAHLDVFFSEDVTPDVRALFISFIDDHVRQHGVDVREHLEIVCASCHTRFPEEQILARMRRGEVDIGCSGCDRRYPMIEGVQRVRDRDADLRLKTWALRTRVEERSREIATTATVSFRGPEPRRNTDAPIRILHLSDLHVAAGAHVDEILQPLEADLRDPRGGLALDSLDYLVVTGDITNTARPMEFALAKELIAKLISRFGLSAQRCLIVPGNHDVDWEEEVYRWKPRRAAALERLAPGSFVEKEDIWLIRDDERYPLRFRSFSEHFYHPLMLTPYPTSAEAQFVAVTDPDLQIQFLALNTSWQIDEQFPRRASVCEAALSRGLDKVISDFRGMGAPGTADGPLRIALFHHPVSGREKMDDGFLERLRQADFRLCLHGHLHEPIATQEGYPDLDRRLHIVGAGSFGAPACGRPESVPRLYNVIEVARDRSFIRVHTRERRKETGAWGGAALWPGATPTVRRTFYEVAGV